MAGTFERYGRTYHLLIRGAEDLQRVLDLDDALWVATGAPVDSLRDDADFLDLLDSDDNQRIMCFEVRDAVRWLLDHLSDFSRFNTESTTLRLEDVRTDGADGDRILTAARKIAGARTGDPVPNENPAGQQDVTLQQIREVKNAAAMRPVSEQGVVLPEAAEDESSRAFLEAIVATTGGVEHPSGGRGVDTATLEKFTTEGKAWLSWREAGKDATVTVLGEATAAISDLVESLRPKIDEYFAITRALRVAPTAFDGQELAGRIGEAIRQGDAERIAHALSEAPVSTPRQDGQLSLQDGANPYYQEQLRRLAREAIVPLLSRYPSEDSDSATATLSDDALDESGWTAVRAALAPYRQWRERRPESGVNALADSELESYLAPDLHGQVTALIDHAVDTSVLLENVRLVEKLALYQGHLLRFLNNFVSFPFVYQPQAVATFDMGRLVMDGRHFNLAVRVPDRGRHKTVAATSSMFVLYVRVIGGPPLELAVPVTDGGIKNLAVGKRGLFRTVDGKEWDAEVVDMIANPISVAETIASPFKRIGSLITKKIETLTADAQARLDTATTNAVAAPGAAATANASTASGTAAAGPVTSAGAAGSGGGLIAGSGVAIAAVGTALTYFARTISTLSIWRVLLGLGAAIAAVVVPMTVLALLKLRRRDLSAILEGSGWAVNLRMRLTSRQARYFTQTPRLPLTARRGLLRRLVWTLTTVVIAAVLLGLYWILFLR